MNRKFSEMISGLEQAIAVDEEARKSKAAMKQNRKPLQPETLINFVGKIGNFQKVVDKRNCTLGNCMADFEVLKEIGRGSYGTIFLVKSKFEI